MKSIISILSILLVTSSGFAKTEASTEVKKQTSEVAPASPREIKVGVNGMVCAFCAQGIEKNFKSHKEVESVQVSLTDKFVKIRFKEGQRLDNAKIAEILKDAGYEAKFGE